MEVLRNDCFIHSEDCIDFKAKKNPNIQSFQKKESLVDCLNVFYSPFGKPRYSYVVVNWMWYCGLDRLNRHLYSLFESVYLVHFIPSCCHFWSSCFSKTVFF